MSLPRALAVAAACGGAACSLSTSLADLTDPVPGAAPADAGSDSASPVKTFCDRLASKPVMCADFDQDRPLDFGWSTTTLTAGGLLDVERAAGVLRSTTPAIGSTGMASAYLGYAVVKRGSRLHVEARVRAVQLSGGEVTPFALEQHSSSGAYRGLILYIDARGAMVQEETDEGGFKNEQHPLPGPTVIGQWKTYAMDLAFGPSSVSLEVTVDGVSTLKLPALTYAWQDAPFLFDAGVAYSLTTDAVSFELDNVIVDVR